MERFRFTVGPKLNALGQLNFFEVVIGYHDGQAVLWGFKDSLSSGVEGFSILILLGRANLKAGA